MASLIFKTVFAKKIIYGRGVKAILKKNQLSLANLIDNHSLTKPELSHGGTSCYSLSLLWKGLKAEISIWAAVSRFHVLYCIPQGDQDSGWPFCFHGPEQTLYKPGA